MIAQPKKDLDQLARLHKDALVCYAQLSDAELDGLRNAFEHELADCGDLDPASAEVCRDHAGVRLDALRAVQGRRARRSDPARSVAMQDWSDLADRVRREVDILEIFAAAGVPLIHQGKEWGTSCFDCGGVDRLRIFPLPDERRDHPRAWCRQCGGYWDAIGCLRNLSMGLGYFDAVSELARELGIPTPNEAATHAQQPTTRGSSTARLPLVLASGVQLRAVPHG